MVSRKKQHSEETKEIARERVADGESLSAVAREMGVAKSTLAGWLNGNGGRNGGNNNNGNNSSGNTYQDEKQALEFLSVENLEPRQRAFLAAYSQMGNVTKAVKIAGIGRTTHYKWLKASDEYREAFIQAEEAAGDRLEEEAWRRAVEGTRKPVYYKGMKVGFINEYSDTLLMFLLNGMRPEKFKRHSSHEMTGKDGGPIEIDSPRDKIASRIASIASKFGKGEATK